MESLLQRIVLEKRLYRILTYVNNAQFFFEMNTIQGKIALTIFASGVFKYLFHALSPNVYH